MKITAVKILELKGRAAIDPEPGRGVTAMDVYAEYGKEALSPQTRTKKEKEIVQYFVKIETDEGPAGIHGPILLDQCMMIQQNYAKIPLGFDPFDSNKIWDLMYLSNRHGINGINMMALSAVDIAIWDLKGKITGLPVHKLLGGATREKMEIYASSYPNFEFEKIKERAKALKEMGFRHQKWFFRYGPGAGKEGADKNILMAKMLREAVGYDIRLMYDCRRAWDVDFAVSVCRGVEQYDPYWVEDPFSVHQLDSHRRLRKATRAPIATGEHLQTRWEAKPYLDDGLLDFLQCDPEWCGGITEFVRIIALSQTYSVKVIPHGHLIRPAMHAAISQSPLVCPLCEYIFIGNQDRNQYFLKEKHFTTNGFIPAPVKPGLSMEFDESKIESQKEVTFCIR